MWSFTSLWYVNTSSQNGQVWVWYNAPLIPLLSRNRGPKASTVGPPMRVVGHSQRPDPRRGATGSLASRVRPLPGGIAVEVVSCRAVFRSALALVLDGGPATPGVVHPQIVPILRAVKVTSVVESGRRSVRVETIVKLGSGLAPTIHPALGQRALGTSVGSEGILRLAGLLRLPRRLVAGRGPAD